MVPATAGVTTPTDPNGHYLYGRQILALTDQLNGTTSFEHAAALTDQVLEPIDGLLERVAEFFEAAAEKAKESDHDDGFDLHYDLEDAASTLRGLVEDLHVAVDRMRALAPPPLCTPERQGDRRALGHRAADGGAAPAWSHSVTAQETPGPLAGLEQAAHLHALAERIHHAADDLPAPESTHSLASISEEVEDQVSVIAGIFASLAHEAAVHGRAAKQVPGAADSLARRKVALMTRAADPLGWALAKLGEAVAQIGHLHEISASPRTPERARAIDTARAALDDRLFSAHRHLTAAAGTLHRDADLLVAAASGARRAPTAPPGHPNRSPAALPVPVPPTASRTLR